MNVAQVDATENAILSDLYEIEGFPTLYFFENVRSVSFVHLVGQVRRLRGSP